MISPYPTLLNPTQGPDQSQQAIRGLTPVFFETSAKLAVQWTKLFDVSSVDEMEIDITNWAGRFACVHDLSSILLKFWSIYISIGLTPLDELRSLMILTAFRALPIL